MTIQSPPNASQSHSLAQQQVNNGTKVTSHHNGTTTTSMCDSEKLSSNFQAVGVEKPPPLSNQHTIITMLLEKNPLEASSAAGVSHAARREDVHTGGNEFDIAMLDIDDAASGAIPLSNGTTTASSQDPPQVALIEVKWWSKYMELLEEQSRRDFEEKNKEDSMQDVDDEEEHSMSTGVPRQTHSGAAAANGSELVTGARISMPHKMSDPDLVPLPPIDNSDLLSNLEEWRSNPDNTKPIISNNTIEKTHFEYISVDAFEQLLRWYGGGPRIYRNVVKQSTDLFREDDLIVDLYPMRILIAVHENHNTFHKFEEIEVFKGTTVKQLRELIEKRHNLNFSSARLWEAYCGSPYKVLEDERTLAEIDAQRDRSEAGKMQFLLEGKKKSHERYSLDTATVPSTMVSGPSFSGRNSYSHAPSYSSPYSRWGSSFSSKENSGDARRSTPGVCGLSNLGNTCFMNSALQCLSKTPQIRDYFVQGLFSQEINKDNPLGMNGEIAQAFASIMKLIWSGENSSISPRGFKHTIGKFAPQFVGFQQHDSCELVQYLLDGLHEDLNRIKNKPYTQIVEGKNLEEHEAADRAWKVHKLRNDSIIVDRFKGQLKSTLVCPQCKNMSITFDPFMYLPLPLPDAERHLPITVMYHKGRKRTTKFSLEIKKYDTFAMVRPKLAAMAEVDPDSLLFVEIFRKGVHKIFGDKDSAGRIPSNDHIWAYEIPSVPQQEEKGKQDAPRIVEVSVCDKIESYVHGRTITDKSKLMEAPILLTYEHGKTTNKELYDNVLGQCLSLLSIEQMQLLDIDLNNAQTFLPSAEQEDPQKALIQLRNKSARSALPYNDEPAEIDISRYRDTTNVECILNGKAAHIDGKNLNEIMGDSSSSSLIALHESAQKSHNKESARLDKCFDLFRSTEQLGKEDMWRCPVCKEPVQAEKTIELWKLPEVLVIQLKRFQFHQYLGGKIDTFVDYPLKDLDLSAYVPELAEHKHYDLFAVSNHFGGLGGGHYIAHAKVGDEWYRFDDSITSPVKESAACSSDAYILFYTSKNNSPVQPEQFKDGKQLVKEWGLEEHAQG